MIKLVHPFNASAPATLLQLIESDFGYVLKIPLPGVRPEDVRIEQLPGSRLAITATRRQRSSVLSALPDLYASLPEVFGLPSGGCTWGSGTHTDKKVVSWTLPEDANVNSVRAEFKVRRGVWAALPAVM
jgi:hypothetical protein